MGVVEDRFEVAPEAKVDTSISYGLTVHSRSDQGGTASSEQGGSEAGGAAALQTGRGVQNGIGPAAPNVTTREWETKAFKVIARSSVTLSINCIDMQSSSLVFSAQQRQCPIWRFFEGMQHFCSRGRILQQ